MKPFHWLKSQKRSAPELPYEPPTDQVTLHRVLEAVYKSAEEGKEVRF